MNRAMKTNGIRALMTMVAALVLAACGGGGGGGDDAPLPVIAGGGAGGGGAAPTAPAEPTADGPTDSAEGTGGTDTTGTAGDGTLPAAPVLEHRYLAAILDDAGDADLARAFERAAAYAGEPAERAIFVVEPVIGAGMADRVRAALGAAANEPPGVAGLAYLQALADAARRAERARAREIVLEQEIAGSALAGDPALVAARAETSAAIARVEAAVEAGLGAMLGALPAGADGLDVAIPPIPFDDANVLGMAALDAAVLSGNLLTRARAGEPAAMDALVAMYDAYDAMLTANPVALPNAAATRATVALVRDEIARLRDALGGLRLAAYPVAGEPGRARVRAANVADQAGIEWTAIGEASVAVTPDGLEIDPQGLAEPCAVEVRARRGALEESLVVHVAPIGADQGDPAPEPAYAIRGRLVDADGQPVALAQIELREIDAAGPIARDLEGNAVAGPVDGNGEFFLGPLREGAYMLVVMAPGLRETILPAHAGDPVYPVLELDPIVLENE